MHTTLDLPEELMEQARTALGFKSKTDTVIFALRELARQQRIDELKTLLGTIQFDVDPVAVRRKDRTRIERGRA